MAASWSTVLTVVVRAASDRGGMAFFAAASFYKYEIMCFITVRFY